MHKNFKSFLYDCFLSYLCEINIESVICEELRLAALNFINFNTQVMLKILLLFVLVSFSSLQTAESDSAYLHYFTKINKAELAIADSRYEESLSIYKSLFAIYPHSFYKDLHNACLCALKLEKYKEALSFARDLVKHGYELKDFESKAFDSFRNQKKYWKQFLSEYPKLRKQYTETLDEPLRNSYHLLYITDQDAASHQKEQRRQDSIFYKLAVSVSGLIKTHGFPQWMINKDTMNTQLYVMLRHYCGLENRIKNDETMQMDSLYIQMQHNDIRVLATQALTDGWILPEAYANIVTYWDNSNPYGEMAIKIDFEKEQIMPFLKALPEKRNDINRMRESIGLPPVNELTQDAIKASWYKDFPFQKIKEAWLACDTCLEILDYMRIATNLELEVSNNYRKSYFIIPDADEINNIYFIGVKQYQKNLKNKKNE